MLYSYVPHPSHICVIANHEIAMSSCLPLISICPHDITNQRAIIDHGIFVITLRSNTPITQDCTKRTIFTSSQAECKVSAATLPDGKPAHRTTSCQGSGPLYLLGMV